MGALPRLHLDAFGGAYTLGRAMINWDVEWPLIIAEAIKHGVDPRFIRAIRAQEAGGPGKEFGVLSVGAGTYDLQLHDCCNSVAHRAADFDAHDPPLMMRDLARGLYYSDEFIVYFGKIWAPLDAANDPNNLNANWVKAVTTIYKELVGL